MKEEGKTFHKLHVREMNDVLCNRVHGLGTKKSVSVFLRL